MLRHAAHLAHLAYLRGHVHDAARQAGGLECAGHGAGNKEGGLGVQCQHRVDIVFGDFVEGLGAVGAGIVDKHLERAVCSHGLVYGDGFGHVEHQSMGTVAACAQSFCGRLPSSRRLGVRGRAAVMAKAGQRSAGTGWYQGRSGCWP